MPQTNLTEQEQQKIQSLLAPAYYFSHRCQWDIPGTTHRFETSEITLIIDAPTDPACLWIDTQTRDICIRYLVPCSGNVTLRARRA